MHLEEELVLLNLPLELVLAGLACGAMQCWSSGGGALLEGGGAKEEWGAQAQGEERRDACL